MIGRGAYPRGEETVVKVLGGHGGGCFGGEDVDFAGGDVGIGSVEDGGGQCCEGEVGGEVLR